jgi:hypothetical protein
LAGMWRELDRVQRPIRQCGGVKDDPSGLFPSRERGSVDVFQVRYAPLNITKSFFHWSFRLIGMSFNTGSP